MSLIDDDTHVIYDILQVNGIHTLLKNLSIPFQDIDGIKRIVSNKRQLLNMAATNKLKILKSFNIHNKLMKTPSE